MTVFSVVAAPCFCSCCYAHLSCLLATCKNIANTTHPSLCSMVASTRHSLACLTPTPTSLQKSCTCNQSTLACVWGHTTFSPMLVSCNKYFFFMPPKHFCPLLPSPVLSPQATTVLVHVMQTVEIPIPSCTLHAPAQRTEHSTIVWMPLPTSCRVASSSKH